MIKTSHYTITRENLPMHELAGLPLRVTQSHDTAKVGIEGMVVDETARTFIVETPAGEKTVPKNESVFTFTLNDEQVEIAGKDILSSSIERLKNGGKALYG